MLTLAFSMTGFFRGFRWFPFFEADGGPRLAVTSARSAGSAGSAGSAARAAAVDEPQLTLVSMNPPIGRPGSEVAVTLRVANTSGAPVSGLSVSARIGRQRLVTRSALGDWASDQEEGFSGQDGVLVATEPVEELLPGESAEVVLHFETDTLGLSNSAIGPREMSISLHDIQDGDIDFVNTFFIWDPVPFGEESSELRVPISLLAPITGPAFDPNDPLAEIEPLLVPAGRLGSVIQAVNVAASATGVPDALSLAIDPALVAIVSQSDNPSAETWLDNINTTAEQTYIYVLPPYDPDLAALAHARLTPAQVQAATNVPLPNQFEVPSNWSSRLAWPADWVVPDAATHNAAIDAGMDIMVNPAGSRAVWGTATGLDLYASTAGHLGVLINDVPLARAFTDATSGASDNQAVGLQRVLAETLVVSEQSETSAPHLLIALPRDWQPPAHVLHATLISMVESGWISFQPTNDLLNSAVPNVNRVNIPVNLAHGQELPPDKVRELVSGITALNSLAQIAAYPYYVTANAEAAMIAPLSQAWRIQNDKNPNFTRNDVLEHGIATIAHLEESLTVSAAGATLISAEGAIPLLVHNDFPSEVTVQVVLQPLDSRLIVDAQPLVTVPEHTTLPVQVPVRAIASGDVEVSVQLLSEQGTVVASGGVLQLRVRAGWESVGTGFFSAGLGILLTAGIIRTVRRGRSPRRTSAETAPYPKIIDGPPVG
jgi:hypothetical protein